MAVSLLLVEQFYFPEGWGGAEIPRDLTTHLSAAGYTVEVLCGSHRYSPLADEVGSDPRALGVRIRRVPALPLVRGRYARVFRQIWFYMALLPMLILRRPPDIFVTQTNPPFAVVLVALVARLWRRPLIIIAMDIYPEVLFAHRALRREGLFGRTLAAMFRWGYRSAQRVVALGPCMTRRLQEKGVVPNKIVEISNWATGGTGIVRGAENSLRKSWGLENCFVLVYSGNLGAGHDVETLLRAVDLARRSIPELRLQIIGQGRRLPEVIDLVQQLNLQSFVGFSPLVPRSVVPESLGLADMAVVTLRPGFEGLIVPSKTLSYIARGVPVLFVGPQSDISDMLQRYDCGVTFVNDDAQGVAEALVELRNHPERLAVLSANGKAAYVNGFSLEHALCKYDSVIRSCLPTDRAKQ